MTSWQCLAPPGSISQAGHWRSCEREPLPSAVRATCSTLWASRWRSSRVASNRPPAWRAALGGAPPAASPARHPGPRHRPRRRRHERGSGRARARRPGRRGARRHPVGARARPAASGKLVGPRGVAQLVERRSPKPKVAGSSPVAPVAQPSRLWLNQAAMAMLSSAGSRWSVAQRPAREYLLTCPQRRGTGGGGQEGFRIGVQGSPHGAAVSRSARRDGLE